MRDLCCKKLHCYGVFLQVLQPFPVSITAPARRTYLHLNTNLMRRTSGQILETPKHGSPFTDVAERWREKVLLHYLTLQRVNGDISRSEYTVSVGGMVVEE